MTKPYRPSSGTEGNAFMSAWCARCTKEAAARKSGDPSDGCTIMTWSMAVRIGHDLYPPELVQDERGPRCTAFEVEKAA